MQTKDETQPKKEPLKGGIVEDNLEEEKVEPNREPLKVVEIVEEEKLPNEKGELDQELLEGEIVEEDKLAKEKVEVDQEPLGEEDKLPKEKVELDQEPLDREIVQVVQEPSEIEITEEDKLPEEAELDQEDQLLKLEFHPWLAAFHKYHQGRDELAKKKEVNGERNKDLLELKGVYEGDEDEDSYEGDEDEDSDEEGEDGKNEEEEEEYEYPKLKATDCYKFCTEIEFENRLKKELIIDYKEQCLILEEEKKDLTAKLAAASESLEQYLQNEKYYLEDRNNWLIEKQNLSLKLDDAQTAYSQAKDEASKASLPSTEMQEGLVRELSETSSGYQCHQLHWFEMIDERNRFSSQLRCANSLAEIYKACLDDCENESRKLREERDDLSAKLFAKTSYAEYYHKLFQEMQKKNKELVKEMEEKNRKLEEEKTDLAAKLCAAKAMAELYRSCLHDSGF